jgi:hypothetical protein
VSLRHVSWTYPASRGERADGEASSCCRCFAGEGWCESARLGGGYRGAQPLRVGCAECATIGVALIDVLQSPRGIQLREVLAT